MTADELGKPGEFTERLVAKINDLNPADFSERRLARKARTLMEMVRDSSSGNYPHLSALAHTETTVALLKFIDIEDDIRDTFAGGLEDDLRRLSEVCSSYRPEIERYLNWKRRS